MSGVAVKICGLRRQVDIEAAIQSGARYIGFVFFEKSPRHVTLEEARKLALEVRPGIVKVALVVDPSDEFLSSLTETVPVDMLQLHGTETPQRVAEIKARFGLPVMKAVGISGPDDLQALDAYGKVADQILVDAKAPKGADRPGGNGHPFDWTLIANRRWPVPWMLAGGLTTQNVAKAVATTGARQIDLSSAVETAPGVKSPELITRFVETVKEI